MVPSKRLVYKDKSGQWFEKSNDSNKADRKLYRKPIFSKELVPIQKKKKGPPSQKRLKDSIKRLSKSDYYDDININDLNTHTEKWLELKNEYTNYTPNQLYDPLLYSYVWKILDFSKIEIERVQKILKYLRNNSLQFRQPEIFEVFTNYTVFQTLDDRTDLLRKLKVSLFENGYPDNDLYMIECERLISVNEYLKAKYMKMANTVYPLYSKPDKD